MQQDSEQSSHMDRLTQTQNSIDELIQIMYSSLSYLTRKANFKPLNPSIPITQTIPNSDSPEVFAQNVKELVVDFERKAKQLEYLISVLPSAPGWSNGSREATTETLEEEDNAEFVELEKEMLSVNQEYLEALGEAKELHHQLSTTLRTTLDARAILPSSSATI